MSAQPRVAVLTITHNAQADLDRYLDTVARFEGIDSRVYVLDNASTDGTAASLEQRATEGPHPLELELSERNLGFAEGMNRLYRRAAPHAEWALLLNADAWPAPDYAARLIDGALSHAEYRFGAATGRIVRSEEHAVLDACGMRLERSWRHLDRGSGESDRGQFAHPARVFGATGAASIFRTQALDDCAFGADIFDPAFHSYREDAELCFRLQERGWDVLYEPLAEARHRRFNRTHSRAEMPRRVNYHSLKNRYLIRLYHQTWSNLLRTLPQTTARELLILGYLLLREWTSIPAYAWVLANLGRSLTRRRQLTQGRLRSVEPWFANDELPL